MPSEYEFLDHNRGGNSFILHLLLYKRDEVELAMQYKFKSVSVFLFPTSNWLFRGWHRNEMY